MRISQQRMANYGGKIALIDDRVGRLLDVLDERGWTENTLVIFLSDHGEMGGDHGRYHKSVFFECAVRIPFAMRWPAALPAGAGRRARRAARPLRHRGRGRGRPPPGGPSPAPCCRWPGATGAQGRPRRRGRGRRSTPS